MKRKTETSKKLAWLSGICFIIALVYSVVIFTYCTINDKICDFAILMTLITVTGASFGTTAAFYYTKSKAENLFKIKRSFLKSKYLILKDINILDESYVQSELTNELSKIECGLETEEDNITNEDITYNG